MSTRSHIGILRENGNIEVVYCHYDGYLGGVGVTLLANYNSLDKVKELINKGSFSSLGNTIEETDYYNESGWDIPWEYSHQVDYLKGYKNKDFFDIEYTYLFDEKDNQWLVAEYPKSMDEYISLKDRLDNVYLKNPDEQKSPVSLKELIRCFHEYQEDIIDYLINKGIDKTKEQLVEEMKVFSLKTFPYVKDYYFDVICPRQKTDESSVMSL